MKLNEEVMDSTSLCLNCLITLSSPILKYGSEVCCFNSSIKLVGIHTFLQNRLTGITPDICIYKHNGIMTKATAYKVILN